MNCRAYILSPLLLLIILLISVMLSNGLLSIISVGSKGLDYESSLDKALFNYYFNKTSYQNYVIHYSYFTASNSSGAYSFESELNKMGAYSYDYSSDKVVFKINYHYNESTEFISINKSDELIVSLNYPLTLMNTFSLNKAYLSSCFNSHCYTIDEYFTNCLDSYNSIIVPFKVWNYSVPNYFSGNVYVGLNLVNLNHNMTSLFPYNLGFIAISCE